MTFPHKEVIKARDYYDIPHKEWIRARDYYNIPPQRVN